MAGWERILTEGDDGNYKNSNIQKATSSALGGVKIGSGVSIDAGGTISVSAGSDTTVSSMAFDTSSGVLTLTDSASNTTTVDLDGRFITSQTDTQDLSISGRVISLVNGGSVTVPASSSNDFTTAHKNKVDFLTVTQAVDLDTMESNIATNNAKTGITSSQASAITANTAKTGITSSQASAITANTAKVGITTAQANAITANTAKTGITSTQASNISTNNGKVSCTESNVKSILASLDSNDTLYIGDAGNDSTISIRGNLTVSGTTTTVNTEEIKLADNFIVLNSNQTGTPSEHGGIEVERGSSSNVLLYWREDSDRWLVDTGADYRGEILTTTTQTSNPSTNDNGIGVGHFWYNSSSRGLYVRKT
jgi:hypothetical protein